MRPTFILMAAVVLAVVSSNRGHATADDRVDFNRDIRSILSDKCFLCHGPDEATREAGLRLDQRDDAIDYSAIVPGDPDASQILARISSKDPDMVMPPPSTDKSVTANERELLTRWIRQDAIYDQHWAFEPPTSPDVPTVSDPSWPRNPIDAFVSAKLESLGLKPSPPADPATLARRISLDLTGLPPSIAEVDAIEQSADPSDRVEEMIEHRLGSPHFGERWARWWLDAARYADSAGYEKDMQRQVFFYRDWVIDAMNRDMPYDQFVIQQVAGDLLPGAGQNERVATGFLRNSMTNEEGGADAEQFRVEGMFDRVDAIGKAVLGITTQCAQCHTHKYDPISHREYYQMFAALNDIEEACIAVYTPRQALRRDEIHAIVAGEEAALRASIGDWKDHVRRWADLARNQMPAWTTVTPTDIPFEGQKFRILEDGSILSESYAPTKGTSSFSLTTDVGTITAVRLDALTHPQLPRGGPGRSIDGTGALTQFKLTVTPTAEGSQPIEAKFARAIADVSPPRRKLEPQYRNKDAANDDRVVGPVQYAIDDDDKTAWTTDLGPGRSNRSRHAVFILESPIVIDGEATLTFSMNQSHGGWNSDDNQNFLFGRYRFSVTDAASLPETAVDSLLETSLAIDPDRWSDQEWEQAFSYWRTLPQQLGDGSTSFAETQRRIEHAWQSFPETATQLVAQSRGEPRETFVLTRGNFLEPAESVQPDAPEFLNDMPVSPDAATTPDRLRFAKWLVAQDSPTAARVIVNRIWQAYFGRGLVSTPEDFGFQSASPSHPDLLDYLARELMDNGWRLKPIHRQIVDSATYRQSSAAIAQAWVDDPENRWLARGPRFRMEAEMVRDVALSASGLLNDSLGGRSVYPPAPAFLFEPPTSYGPKIWDTDEGADQYRRSLYVHQYRSVPYPPLQVFDAPKGDAACVRRERSNTPLQALVLLNEDQYLDAARALAARVIRETVDGNDRDRIVRAFRHCTQRRPDNDEIKVLNDLLDDQRSSFATADSKDLSAMLGVATQACRQLTGVDADELAAWMVVARAILNLDETITKS